MVEFTAATYNIHRGIGIDGEYRLDRIVEVLHELDCDVVGIQEIDSHCLTEEGHQLNYIAKKTKYHVVAGPTLVKKDKEYGNALLTRFPVKVLRKIDLSFGRGEPRGAIDVDVEVQGVHCRIITTHLGLRFWERKLQLRKLFEGVHADVKHPLLIMGDMN